MAHRILIVGAGIAGPTLAFWLKRYGFEVTIVERAASQRPRGFAVDFRGSATHVLDRMGLTATVKERETRTGAIVMIDANGRETARLPDGFTSGDIEILRGDLTRLLHEATTRDVIYRYNDTVVALSQDERCVQVTFASGATDEYDYVVGADGLHSGIRALAFPEVSPLRDMGSYIAIYTIPDYLQLHDEARYHVQVGKRVGYFASKADGMAKASFYLSDRVIGKGDSDPLSRSVEEQKQLLRRVFANVGWETRRLLGYLDSTPDLYFDSLTQVRLDRWSAGRVVLLGDAAACASPMAGMGTSIAMTGAYVLAGELARAKGDHRMAFDRYEAALRPFVRESQKMAMDSVGWFIPRSLPKLWLSGKIWSWMPPEKLKELMIDEPARVASSVALQDYAA